jgi:hypothetical protein
MNEVQGGQPRWVQNLVGFGLLIAVTGGGYLLLEGATKLRNRPITREPPKGWEKWPRWQGDGGW